MNIIDAIITIIHAQNYDIGRFSIAGTANNRANAAGDSLEDFVKAAFSGSLNLDRRERQEQYDKYFSYQGSAGNPPDIMLRGGDAIEVKKLQGTGLGNLQLNSSHPKQTLRSDSSLINEDCRNAEDWTEKDMIYVVGCLKNNAIKHVSMVYGTDYCASEDLYLNLKHRLQQYIRAIDDVHHSDSNEIDHIKHIDPLDITDLRIRGMWLLKTPLSTFNYLYRRDYNKDFSLMCIINDKKWHTFDNRSALEALAEYNPDVDIQNVMVKNPDDPSKYIAAKLITYSR